MRGKREEKDSSLIRHILGQFHPNIEEAMRNPLSVSNDSISQCSRNFPKMVLASFEENTAAHMFYRKIEKIDMVSVLLT